VAGDVALALGDRGEDVRRAYEYLERYGYFPNPETVDPVARARGSPHVGR
jgi:hypothetical protein